MAKAASVHGNEDAAMNLTDTTCAFVLCFKDSACEFFESAVKVKMGVAVFFFPLIFVKLSQ